MYPFAYNLLLVAGKCSFNLLSTNIFSFNRFASFKCGSKVFHYLNHFVKDAVKEEKSLYFSRKQDYLLIGDKILRKCFDYSINFQRYNLSVI